MMEIKVHRKELEVETLAATLTYKKNREGTRLSGMVIEGDDDEIVEWLKDAIQKNKHRILTAGGHEMRSLEDHPEGVHDALQLMTKEFNVRHDSPFENAADNVINEAAKRGIVY